MSETWRDLFMDFVANLLIFPTPTHTQDFNKHHDGYGHSNTALMQSLVDRRKLDSLTVLNFSMALDNSEIYDF
jgi:hypothetical protein